MSDNSLKTRTLFSDMSVISISLQVYSYFLHLFPSPKASWILFTCQKSLGERAVDYELS